MDNFTNEKPEHDRSKSRITEDFLYFRKYPDSRCADYINILNINSMETTKTTEKFQSVHKTFSYTPKSALTNQWSSLAFGIGMVIVPLIYPFGLRIRRAVILSPEVWNVYRRYPADMPVPSPPQLCLTLHLSLIHI